MKWLLCGSEYIDDGLSFGFVYLIENTITGRKYIGRKYFTIAGTKQVNGKRKKIRKPSDWQNYYGSNETLKEDVSILGEDKFVRTILHLCKTKSECSYLELWEQMDRRVLESDDYYNEWISAKVSKKNLKNLKR